MDSMYQQYALEAINAHSVLATLRAQTKGRQKLSAFSQVLCTVTFPQPHKCCAGLLCAGECPTAEGHYNSQGARAHSKQKGSEQAGFVQPISNYLEGVNKNEITLFSEEHSEKGQEETHSCECAEALKRSL